MSKVLEGIEHEDQSERFTPFGKPFPVIRRAKVHSPQVIMDVVPPVTWVNRPSPNAGEALDALGLTSTTIETVLLPDDNRTYQVAVLNDDGSVAYRIDAHPPMTDDDVEKLLHPKKIEIWPPGTEPFTWRERDAERDAAIAALKEQIED